MSQAVESSARIHTASSLNRLSWLRDSPVFLNAALESPRSRWVLFKSGNPLAYPASSPTSNAGTNTNPRANGGVLARLPTSVVLPLLGPAPFFGQGPPQEPGSTADPSVEVLKSARHRGPQIVFLGIQEDGERFSALPSSEFVVKAGARLPDVGGTPFWALDVDAEGVEEKEVEGVLKNATEGGEGGERGREATFVEPRTVTPVFTPLEAAIFAQARSMLDWHARYRFCAGCGSSNYSVLGGWKLSCSSLLPWNADTGRKPCPSGTGLHNYAFPRTDPVVVVAITNEANDKMLLGRNKRFPPNFYSALSGFVEPGEDFEAAVVREMWEEVGLSTWNVRYHTSLTWPYPASMLIGFYATASDSNVNGERLRLDLDNELEDARWFTREEVRTILADPEGSIVKRTERVFEDMDEVKKGESRGTEEAKEKVEERRTFRFPPEALPAGKLIGDWAGEEVV